MNPRVWVAGLVIVSGFCPWPLLASPDDTTSDAYETMVRGDGRGDTGPNYVDLDREAIVASGAPDAAALLEREAAIHATSGIRGERIFMLRGFDQRQTLVLVDGALVNIPYEGQTDLSYIPIEMIDHITIVKGPSSVLLGPNGLGGVVNLITRPPGDGPLASARLEVGDLGRWDWSGLHAGRAGPVGWTLYGGAMNRDAWRLSHDFVPTRHEDGGQRENSDAQGWHAGAGVRVDLSDGHDITVSGFVLDRSRGVPHSTEALLPRYWRFSTWRAIGASIGHDGRYGARVETDELAYVRVFDNLVDGYDDATYGSQESLRAVHSWYHDQVAGLRSRGSIRFPEVLDHLTLRWWLGAQFERHVEEDSAWPSFQRLVLTGAPEIELALSPAWKITVANQCDIEIPFDFAGARPSPRAVVGPLFSMAWRPLDALAVSASAARRSRFATLKERFSTGVETRLTNPDLAPESAWHFGLEGRWQVLPQWQIEGAIYDAEVEDLIERVPVGGGVEQMRNIASARHLGTEWSTQVRPCTSLTIDAAYAYLNARRTDNNIPLASRPAHKIAVAVEATPLEWLSLSAAFRWIGQQRYQDPDTRLWGHMGTYGELDARIDIRPAPGASIWLRATNLLDANHPSEYGFPDPGRAIVAGIRLAVDPPRSE